MGTVTIKNISCIKDRVAAWLAMEQWNGYLSEQTIAKQYKVRIIKRGHKFVVVDIEDLLFL